jgi:zinc transporter ZupT
MYENPLAVLAASLAALAISPALYALCRRIRWAARPLDTAILLAIAALVLLEILPECWEMAGASALVAAGAGLFLPLLAEQRHGREHADLHAHGASLAIGRALPWVAIGALGLHALTDGAALAAGLEHIEHHGHDHGGDALALGIVVHHLAEGAAVWSLLRAAGRRVAVIGLGALAATNVVGYLLASAALPAAGSPAVAALQAFAAGALLHVLLHHRDERTLPAPHPA